MRKKILFVTPHMIGAGVEKALLEMLKRLKNCNCTVDVLFVRKRGAFVELIPEYVNAYEIDLPKEQSELLLGGGAKKAVFYNLKKFRLFTACKIAIKKLMGEPFPEFLGNFEKLPVYDKQYDLAICYHMHMPFIVAYVAEKVIADKKILWIHNDLTSSGFTVHNINRYLKKYDKFFAVSEQLRDEFVQELPQYSEKTEVFHNIIDVDDIKRKSAEPVGWGMPRPKNIILSVGRLDKQKGFDLAIHAAKLLKDDGYDFCWFFIGNGAEKDNLINLVNKLRVKDRVVFLGFEENPYSYISDCDIFVQSSRHEGYATTVTEAIILKVPTVSTTVAGASEQIVSGETGVLVEIDCESIYKGVKKILDNPELKEKIIMNLSKSEYSDGFEKFEVYLK